jgi:hypothetical protein
MVLLRQSAHHQCVPFGTASSWHDEPKIFTGENFQIDLGKEIYKLGSPNTALNGAFKNELLRLTRKLPNPTDELRSAGKASDTQAIVLMKRTSIDYRQKLDTPP